MFPNTSAENQFHLDIIVDILETCSIGETIFYSKLAEAIGQPIAPRRWLILKAQRILSRQSGYIFSCVPKIGYQRLPGADAYKIGARARGRINRTARTSANTILRAIKKTNDLTETDIQRAYSEISALGLIEMASQTRTVKALPAVTKPESVATTMQNMLKMLDPDDA